METWTLAPPCGVRAHAIRALNKAKIEWVEAFTGGGVTAIAAAIASGLAVAPLALQTIAQKTNTENGWLAWIPIANIILMLNIARKPIWWIVLFLIPLVGLVMYVIVWMGIAEARNKPSWWGVMVIVPVMNLIMPGYLAWSD